MWCSSCGYQLSPSARFCGACGMAVSQSGAGFRAEAKPQPPTVSAPALSEAWAQLKPWRLKSVFGRIEDRATARALVVGGALAFTVNAAFAFAAGFAASNFFISGLGALAVAAGLWYANSRIAAGFGVFAAACGVIVMAAIGALEDPLLIAQLAAMVVVALGAARGAFAWHGMQAAPLPPAQTSLS